MYFTNGKSRAFEMLMQGKPGFDRYGNGCTPFSIISCSQEQTARHCGKYAYIYSLVSGKSAVFLSLRLSPLPKGGDPMQSDRHFHIAL